MMFFSKPRTAARIYEIIDKKLANQKIDLIIGGPPCQAYSVVGRARSADGMQGDRRNFLYMHYAEFLEIYKPKLFVFENVLGLKSAGNGIYLKNMERLFWEKGYYMKLFTIEANNFGVLQNRKRIIIIGWLKNLYLDIPNLEAIKQPANYKVKNLFSDLPKIQAGGGKDKYLKYRTNENKYLNSSSIRNGINILTQHISRPHSEQDKEIYRIAVEKWNANRERLNYNDLPEKLKTHRNRNSFFDRFKVVAANKPYSQTVVAHLAKDGHYFIHPDIEQNRSISVREAARLQSFPDDYYFGSKQNSSFQADW